MDYTTAVNLRDWLNDIFVAMAKERLNASGVRAVLIPSDGRHTFWQVNVIDQENDRSVMTFHEAVITNYLNLGLEKR